ncbi:LbetaH domain-containing protein [Bifidobacterium animalis]|uniref:hypothetical protein n=1 Tax=Bifidobacterium animalis TaxID=28025 RepID=UPI001BD110A4|nr:hypothetical protein [Bifidobacterium animalis]
MSYSEVTFLKGKKKPTIPSAKLEQAARLAKAYLDASSTESKAASKAFTDFLEGLPAEHLRDIEVLYYRYNSDASFAEEWDDLADRFKTVTHDDLVRDVSERAGLVAGLPARLPAGLCQQLFTAGSYPTSLTLPELLKLVTSCKAYLGAKNSNEKTAALKTLSPLVLGFDQVALREVETLCAYLRPKNPDEAYASYEQAWDALALLSPNPTKDEQINNVTGLYDTIRNLF